MTARSRVRRITREAVTHYWRRRSVDKLPDFLEAVDSLTRDLSPSDEVSKPSPVTVNVQVRLISPPHEAGYISVVDVADGSTVFTRVRWSIPRFGQLKAGLQQAWMARGTEGPTPSHRFEILKALVRHPLLAIHVLTMAREVNAVWTTSNPECPSLVVNHRGRSVGWSPRPSFWDRQPLLNGLEAHDDVQIVSSGFRVQPAKESSRHRGAALDAEMTAAELASPQALHLLLYSENAGAIRGIGAQEPMRPFTAALALRVGLRGPAIPISPTRLDLVVPSAGEQESPRPLTSHGQFGLPELCPVGKVEILHGRHLVKGTQLLVDDSGGDPRQDFAAGVYSSLWSHPTIGGSALLYPHESDSRRTIERGLILTGRADENWFHWLLESLASIAWVDGELDVDVPLVIRDAVPKSGLEALARVTSRPVIHVTTDESVIVRDAHVIKRHHITLDSSWREPLQGRFNAEVLGNLRRILLAGTRSNSRPRARRYSLRASSYRSIANRKELIAVMDALSMGSIRLERLSFGEQVRQVRECEVVVMQGGAGLANMIFAHEDTRFIALVSETPDQKHFWGALASSLGLTLEFLEGPPTIFSRLRPTPHPDFTIDARDLKACIEQGKASHG